MTHPDALPLVRSVPAPRRCTPLGLLLCPHCDHVVELHLQGEVERLVQLHRPGLPRLRDPMPDEQLWWCPRCLLPGCLV